MTRMKNWLKLTKKRVCFVSQILKKRGKLPNTLLIFSCEFLLERSNVLKRFYSLVGLVSNEYRQIMTSMSVAEQLFLKFTKMYWNIEHIKDIVIELSWDQLLTNICDY